MGVLYNLAKLSAKLDGRNLDRAAEELIRRYNGNPRYQGLRKCRQPKSSRKMA